MYSTRRTLLAGGAALVAGGAAGCLGDLESADDGRDVIRLRSLDVRASPGGEIALRPPGKVALLDFFATWCGPCRAQMDNLRELRSEFPEEELFVVSITGESDEKAIRNFWQRYEGTWPVALDEDGEAIREYEVTGIPTLVLLSPDGEQLWRHRGLADVDDLMANTEEAIRETP